MRAYEKIKEIESEEEFKIITGVTREVIENMVEE